jgi:SAM-dependent methyltransferase
MADFFEGRDERDRLAGLEALWDSVTIEHLDRLDVGQGWRCLDVGAGGGTIAQWLSERVGSSGQVVATDIDTSYLKRLTAPNLEVLEHDVTTDDPPGEPFDLIHTRAVLQHLGDHKNAVLGRLTTWLKPGGRILVEDTDWSAAAYPISPAPEFETVMRTVLRFSASTMGSDLAFGRRLAGLLHEFGMHDVGVEGRLVLIRGGSPASIWYGLSMHMLRAHLVAAGVLTDAQLDAAIRLLADPSFAVMSPVLMAAWARTNPANHSPVPEPILVPSHRRTRRA